MMSRLPGIPDKGNDFNQSLSRVRYKVHVSEDSPEF